MLHFACTMLKSVTDVASRSSASSDCWKARPRYWSTLEVLPQIVENCDHFNSFWSHPGHHFSTVIFSEGLPNDLHNHLPWNSNPQVALPPSFTSTNGVVSCTFPLCDWNALIHLLLIRFGPLRHQWCMRFEAKNAYIKGLVGKNFKNLAYSIAQRHQNFMCLQLLSAPGVKTTNFLYRGDEVENGNSYVYYKCTL